MSQVAFAISPARIHARQHLSPVRGVDAAGAGIDADDGVVRVELAVEGGGHLRLIELLFRQREVRFDLGVGRTVLREEREQFASVAERARNCVHCINIRAQLGKLLHDALCGVGIVPKIFAAGARVELADQPRLAGIFKDAP